MSVIVDNFLKEFPIDFALRGRNVVVAGGCLRDAWFGKDIKDIDVFYEVAEDNYRAAYALGYWVMIGTDGNTYKFILDKEGDYEIGNFLSGRCPELPGLNIIFRSGPRTPGPEREFAERLIEGFPASISQIAWSPGTDEWYIHPEFLKTADTKIIKFYENNTDKYFNKINEKYNEGWQYHFETVVPMSFVVPITYTSGYTVKWPTAFVKMSIA